VLFAVRKPIIESGHHVALNPRAPEAAAEAAVYEAVYAYPNGPAVRFDVSVGINAEYGPRKRSLAASRRR
jgi:hypothetical protein